ncbi:Holliday junction resolvase RuvX [Candidatus Collierbacteria bacterium CG10_big_fil_rev_8_21_14_0_10_44_9]|uniref:Putative pre-16S rRNA nuclease n=1 Tax=Candidatus Collierbacteria bacterium CG10_big_fil_rev_8_21_14_0_10_44_9 TaxID=1974535 RepID=A0A2H0VL46_9BACT|nr:MAG: Holliday junction resolvase RuvX [Candidatus Collierbacteria bacterium CG10_big_fil_rev_8_21_14_0_10_44_9]
MKKYLGIDFGLSHIGLATSEHTLATPLPSLVNDSTLISRLVSIVHQEGITHIVCGLPEGQLASKITIFAKELHLATGIPVICHPETLSTQEAIALLRESGASRAKLKDDHSYAACLILEDYLELTASSRA